MSTVTPTTSKPWTTLRKFVRTPVQRIERCELCGAPIPPEHDHVIELNNRQLQCSCMACAILFCDQGNQRFRRVPRRCDVLHDFRLDDSTWESFLIPINLAFFFRHSAHERVVAMYPSPAGATESLLELDTWDELGEANPILRQFAPDIEALLVNRVGSSRDYYRVSIDRCYELVGLIRLRWRGLSGGNTVWEEIAKFFQKLQAA